MIVSSGAFFRAERQARKERRLLVARDAEGLPPGGLEEAARLRAEERGLGRQLDAEGRMVERQKAAELRGEGLRVGAEGRRAGREELEAQDAADAAMASITAGGDPALHAEAVQIRREMAAISDAIAKHGKRIGAADMGQLQAKQVELGKRLGSIAREATAAKTALGEAEDVAAEEQRVKEVAEKRAFKKEDDRVARVFKLNDQLLKIDEEINTLEAKKKTVDQDPTLGLVSDIDAQIKAKEISRKTVQGRLDEAQGGEAETGALTPEDMKRFAAEAREALGPAATQEEVAAEAKKRAGAK